MFYISYYTRAFSLFCLLCYAEFFSFIHDLIIDWYYNYPYYLLRVLLRIIVPILSKVSLFLYYFFHEFYIFCVVFICNSFLHLIYVITKPFLSVIFILKYNFWQFCMQGVAIFLSLFLPNKLLISDLTFVHYILF